MDKEFRSVIDYRPELKLEWSDRNEMPGPDSVSYGSRRIVWWRCVKGHEWQAAVEKRTIRFQNCPICAGRKLVKGMNDFASQCPEIAKEWSSRNGELTPDQVSCGSSKKVWWSCKVCGNEWQTAVKLRSKGSACPFCSGKKVVAGGNDLASQFPELASEWSPKNKGKGPSGYTAGSSHKAIWRCKLGHEWTAQIKNRVQGSGCPYCSDRKVMPGFNDFASKNPDLVAEWSPKNKESKPDMVMPYSNKQIWWICERGHEWKTTVANRSLGSKCPYCTHAVIKTGINDLQITHPEIAMEWSEKNGEKKANQYSAYSRETVWWRCSDCGYEWRAVINNHVKNPWCPECEKKENKEQQAQAFVEQRRKSLFEANMADECIRYYLDLFKEDVIINDQNEIGMTLHYYFPKRRTALEFSSPNHYSKRGRSRECTKNHLCKTNGIKMIRIQDKEDQCYETCICISRDDNSLESFGEALNAAFELMKLPVIVNLGKDLPEIYQKYIESW